MPAVNDYFSGLAGLRYLVIAFILLLVSCGVVLGYGAGREQGRRDALQGQTCEPRRTHAPSPDPAL